MTNATGAYDAYTACPSKSGPLQMKCPPTNPVLRIQTVSKKTCEIAHVISTLNLLEVCLKCHTTVIFWNNERLKLYAKCFKHYYLFEMQNPFQNGLNVILQMVNIISRFLVKNIKILCSSDHLIFFKFCQLVVKLVSKESQIVF